MPEVVRVVSTATLATAAALQTVDDFVDDLEIRLTAARGALIDDIATLTTRLSAARAGYLDVLNALQAGITGAPFALPAAAAGVSAATSTPWVNTAYQQVTASLAADCVLIGVVHWAAVANTDYEVEIGNGAGGSETVRGVVIGHNVTVVGEASVTLLPYPIQFASGTRVAVRFRGAVNGTYGAKLLFQPRPVA